MEIVSADCSENLVVSSNWLLKSSRDGIPGGIKVCLNCTYMQGKSAVHKFVADTNLYHCVLVAVLRICFTCKLG